MSKLILFSRALFTANNKLELKTQRRQVSEPSSSALSRFPARMTKKCDSEQKQIRKKRSSARTADIQFLPFNVGVLEVLLAGVGIRAGAVAAAALAGLDGVDDDEDQEEDSEDAADDDRDQ